MKEITVGMKFQNRANKRMGQVVSIDLATSNAVLNVETANGQYKESKVSLAGLLGQKSWKYIHDDEVAGDGTPMNEVMQEILSDEELAAKKKLEEMLAPANENINKAKSKAKAKVDAEIKQKAEEVKKADAEAAKAEKEENELLAHYQKDIKQKKQKQTESVKKEQAPAEKKAEKKEKPVKEKKARKKREVNTHIDEILDYIYECVEKLGGNIGVPRDAEMKFRALRKENGKQFCKLMWSGKSVKLFSKIKLDKYNCYAINYPLPNVYEFSNCDEKAIKDILTTSFNECADRKTKNTKKEKKED